MRVQRGAVVLAVLAVLGALLAGCGVGVRPTGVIGAGEPASGLTRGARLYFASGSGLRAVPLIDRDVSDLDAVMGPYWAAERDQATGQLVCTLASFQSVREAEVRADDVEVTVRPGEGPALGPLRCAEFLGG
ncbi:hypothetical protein [Streptomyces cyaneofuscatus]|uniref:hypothetical protein n=1 Tax=Streptomyces cyaneofuscatus TaxID=66883 RepID=UPI0013DA34F3|nr:hypothetical protein [Streptomyces cyaneofuscatus]